jgi:hypothetical protein
MNKKTKNTSGMSLGIVVVFIMMMTAIGLAMIVASTSSLRSAQIMPEQDGFYFAAEAAMNRVVPGVVSTLSDNMGIAPSGPPTHAQVATTAMAAAASNELSSLITTAWLGNSLTPEQRQTAMRNHLFRTGSNFEAGVQTAIHNFLNSSLNLPAAHNPVNGVVSNTTVSTSSPYFWLIDGTDTTTPSEGFGAPAFANIQRAGGGSTVLVGGLSESNITVGVPFDTGLAAPTPGYRIWRVPVTVNPHITINSYSGAVQLTQQLNIAFQPFYVEFYRQSDNPAVFATVDGARWACLGYCSQATSCVTNCNHRSATPIVTLPNPPHLYSCQSQPCNGLPWLNNMNISNAGLHGVRYNGGAPPESQTIPAMAAPASNRRTQVYNNAQSTVGGRYNIPGDVPGVNNAPHAIERRASDGRIRVRQTATGSWSDWIAPTGTNFHITSGGTWPAGVTLVGDFSGINIFVQNSAPLTLGGPTNGTTTSHFISQNNTGANPGTRYIATGGPITVNVTNGLVMEHVSVCSTNSNIAFNSPGALVPNAPSGISSLTGSPGIVSMGAEFIATGDINGTISVSGWNSAQIPQFSSHQMVEMRMRSTEAVRMGGLFHNLGGNHIRVGIHNHGAAFDGMFFWSCVKRYGWN